MAAAVKSKVASGRRNRRHELLEASEQIFHEKGYASASIQDVADRVGVLKGSLYHYIDSKEDLLAWVFEESDAQALGLMEEILALEVPAVERLRAFARSWSLMFMKNVERGTIYAREWRHLTGPRRKKVMRNRSQYERRVRELIDAVKREGDGSPGLDSRYASFFVLSGINGLSIWYRRRGKDSAEHIADAYAELIVGMVRGSAQPDAAASRALSS